MPSPSRSPSRFSRRCTLAVIQEERRANCAVEGQKAFGLCVLQPRLLVAYHGLFGSGIALVAYDDGTVILEMNGPGQQRYRREQFAGLAEASNLLALPLQLAAGEVLLRNDFEMQSLCPSYQIIRFFADARDHPSTTGAEHHQFGSEGGFCDASACSVTAVVTWVRFGFQHEKQTQDATDFRLFQRRVAAYQRWLTKNTCSLLERLCLNDEMLAFVAGAEGLGSLDERLMLLGLTVEERFGDGALEDDEWPNDVRDAAEEIRSRLISGEPLLAALRQVFCRQPNRKEQTEELADLSGWQSVLDSTRSPVKA